ncbi:zinc finger protein 135-like isoform X2 [Rhinatrema bivittatum]|uniref:zinc finger protein 135-like isoform X2 n=1 Tax=Rhinatrema bivittatum TaxID=194408 RepID=UPI00112664B4|nr:zinc finger protein 135-like isoform X2 [Rhinatrema bivittatum]
MTERISTAVSVTFSDVAVYFSEKEWGLLDEWQKELYRNVMREIHGALLAMGIPVIHPDILIRVKEEREIHCHRIKGPKGQDNAENSSTDMAVASAPQLKIKQEDEPYSMDQQDSEESNSNDSPMSSYATANPDLLLIIKEEEEEYSMDYDDSDGGESIVTPPRDGTIDQEGNDKHPEEWLEELQLLEATSGIAVRQQGHLSGCRTLKSAGCERGFDKLSPHGEQQPSPLGDHPFSFNDIVKHERKHGMEKMHVCSVCGRGFRANSTLTVHKRTHTGERPFQCRECEKRFSRNSTLTVHMRTHTGEKPYKCTQCSKSYSQSYSLKLHQKSHTGEKRSVRK